MVGEPTSDGAETSEDREQEIREAAKDPDTCTRCLGKGYVTVPNTARIPRRSECSECDGTGHT